MEEWREIAGFPNYSVSDLGRIVNNQTDRILNPSQVQGFDIVALRRDNRPKNHYVHRVVADAFFDIVIDGLIVKHVNGNKRDSSIYNLMVDQTSRAPFPRGEGRRILIQSSGLIFDSVAECARHIGGTPAGVYAVLNHNAWTHRGLSFRYLE